MKIICIKEYLSNALRMLSRISTQNATLPILSSICLGVKEGQITLMATNLEVGVITTMRASIEKEGAIAIPAHMFSSVIDGLESKKVTIESKGGGVLVEADGFSAEINGMDSKEFPLIPKVKGDLVLVCDGNSLAQAITQVVSSVAISSMRPDLAGVCMIKEKNTVCFVATDGFRLSERKVVFRGNEAGDGKMVGPVIVPTRTALEIARIFNKSEDSINVSIGENQLVVQAPRVYLVSRVIEGNFPDYKQVIPKFFKTQAVVGREDVLKAIKMSSLFTSNETNDIVVSFLSSKGKLVVMAQAESAGKVTRELPGEVTGDDVVVVLNHKYLLDGLNGCDSKEVVFSLNEENTPVVIEPKTTKGKSRGFLYLISPIRKQQ